MGTPELQLRLTFTNTLDDYREAQAPVGKKKRKIWRRGLLGWVCFWLLTAVLIFLEMSGGRPQGTVQATPADDLLPALIPPVIPTLCVVSLLLFPWKSLRSGMHRRVLLSRSIFSSTTLAALALCIVLLVCNVHYFVSTPRGARIAASICPSLVLFVVILLIFTSERRYAFAAAWERQPTLRLPRTVELSDRGYFDVTELTELLYLWPCFKQVRETDNLYVLKLVDGRFFMLPKRAFVDELQEVTFRARISEIIADAQLVARQGGFRVIPIEAKPQVAAGQEAVTPPAVSSSNPPATKDAG